MVLYKPHRYLLPVATAVAMSRSTDRYITDLAELDPDSISSEEIAQWVIRIVELDPSRTRTSMKPDTAEKVLIERLLASLQSKQ